MDDKIPPARFVDGPAGRLALISREGRGPGLFWLGGYASDMRGSKAEAIDSYADDEGLAYTRFDYSGHGESEGAFEDGVISSWYKDAEFILTHETEGPQILIGSSMGGWMASLLLRQHPDKVAGVILINPAPDFATELTPHQMPKEIWDTIQREGKIEIPSEYDDSVMIYTKAMFDDGARTRVLDQALHAACPVRMFSGMSDDVVPSAHVVRLADHMQGDDITVTLVKGGDHRLSSPEQIRMLLDAIEELTS